MAGIEHTLTDGLHRLATRRGAWVLGLVLALTLPLGWGYLTLPWTQNPEVITLQGSDALDFYRGYVKRWGSDKWIVLAYEVEDAFAPQRLAQLRELTDALFEIEGVHWVSSLDSAFAIDIGPFGPYKRPLVPDEIQADAELRRSALESRWIRDALVSSDGRTLALGIQLEGHELDTSAAETRILRAIDQILARPAFAGLDVRKAGSPVFNRELGRLNARDQALFVPLTVAVIALFLLLLLQSAWLTGAALLVLLFTVAWTLGAMSWLGIPLNITTGLLPPLLLVVCVAESVHLLSALQGRLRTGESREAAVRFVVHEVLPSCFWTTVTTAVGFASLLTVRIESVRTFALFAVLGVWIALFQLAVLLPALLLRLPLRTSAATSAPDSGAAAATAPRFAWLLRGVQSAARTPLPALALLLLGLGIAAVGIPRIDVSTHDGEFFSERNPLNQAYRFIESHLQGVTPLEVEVEAPQDGAFRGADAIQRLAALQRALAGYAELSAGTSAADLLLTTNPGLALDDAAAVQRALFLVSALAPEELERLVDESGRRARISARAKAMSSSQNQALLTALEAQAAQIFPPDWQVRFTGLVPVFSQMEQYLVDGQVQSYGLAVLAIAIIFALVFRSASVLGAALLANVVPVAATLGIMGLAGIRLDVATIMVASIAEGIIVDDTIHFVHVFRGELARSGDPARALEFTLGLSGLAVVTTGLILAAGFAIPMLSDFEPTAHFGLLVCVTVLTALAAELLIMPPALLWIYRRHGALEPRRHSGALRTEETPT